jgi:hypothetical protein
MAMLTGTSAAAALPAIEFRQKLPELGRAVFCELARQPCVILSPAAAAVLGGHPGAIHVRLRAPLAARIAPTSEITSSIAPTPRKRSITTTTPSVRWCDRFITSTSMMIVSSRLCSTPAGSRARGWSQLCSQREEWTRHRTHRPTLHS